MTAEQLRAIQYWHAEAARHMNDRATWDSTVRENLEYAIGRLSDVVNGDASARTMAMAIPLGWQ
jgi:hypothetical protein